MVHFGKGLLGKPYSSLVAQLYTPIPTTEIASSGKNLWALDLYLSIYLRSVLL